MANNEETTEREEPQAVPEPLETVPSVDTPDVPAPEEEQDIFDAMVDTALPIIGALRVWMLISAQNTAERVIPGVERGAGKSADKLNVDLVPDFYDFIAGVLGKDSYILQYYNDLSDDHPILAFGLFVYVFIMTIAGKISGHTAHIMEETLYDVNKDDPIGIPDVQALLSGSLKGYEDKTQITDWMDKLGYDTDAQSLFMQAIKEIAPIDVLIENERRGLLADDELENQLARQGYDADQQEYFQNILKRLAPVQDVIRFAVREAYDEEIAGEFQLDEAYPEKLTTEGKKHGFDADILKNYWRAHWELPSPLQVFEMLHRGVIDEDTLDRYLRIADYSNYWRDKLKAISFRPLTRVDVRRMYRVGTFDNLPDKTPREALIRAYKDVGYSPDNADLMADFTEDFVYQQKLQFTSAKLRSLYVDSIIDLTTYDDYLNKMHINTEDIGILISEAEYARDEKLLKAFMKVAEMNYKSGEWGVPEIVTEAANRDLTITDINNLVEQWNLELQAVTSAPTKADILDWLEKGIYVTWTDARADLVKLGYSVTIAERYIQERTIDMGADLKKLRGIGYVTSKDEAIKHMIFLGFSGEEAANYVETNWIVSPGVTP